MQLPGVGTEATDGAGTRSWVDHGSGEDPPTQPSAIPPLPVLTATEAGPPSAPQSPVAPDTPGTPDSPGAWGAPSAPGATLAASPAQGAKPPAGPPAPERPERRRRRLIAATSGAVALVVAIALTVWATARSGGSPSGGHEAAAGNAGSASVPSKGSRSAAAEAAKDAIGGAGGAGGAGDAEGTGAAVGRAPSPAGAIETALDPSSLPVRSATGGPGTSGGGSAPGGSGSAGTGSGGTAPGPARVPTPAPNPNPKPSPKPPAPAPSSAPASKANPYTPSQVCGAGYSQIDQQALGSTAKIYLLYDGTRNCVVTMKYGAGVGTAQAMTAWVQVQGSSTKQVDSGSYAYYAGPKYVTAPGRCVKWGGTYAGTSYTSGWEHCG